ncbi:MAG: NAD-dependent epimerase/dehydratase family protein [Acidobacteria bacterium]|nr:NAD-dependent epimerase/dehydratase family protein [Acidobacteriota bacterium]
MNKFQSRPLSDRVLREIFPRVIADLILVHLSALASLAAALLWQMSESRPLVSPDSVAELRSLYLTTFVPLSVIFPVVFLASGFYTRNRSYASRYKLFTLARGATAASLAFILAAFLMARAGTLPRSAAVTFILMVNATTIGARLMKQWFHSAGGADPEKNPNSVQSGIPQPDKPVLVVGGGGYIGSILCRKLLAQGRKVRLLDSFVYGDSAVRELFGHPNFELQIGDCRNIQSVVSAMNGASAVVHLAAIVGDPACEQDKSAALEINYAATRMMTEIAKGYGVERFLFASSCSVYGETEEIVDEQSEVGPISLYAQTKVDSEQALLRARTDRFHPTILRLATVFGNSYRPRFDLVVNLLTAKSLREGVITIYNGEQWRPFIHVSDVAEGFLTALDAPLSVVSGEVYNLGDSRLNYTLTQVADTIQRLVPGTRVEHIENPDRRNYRVCFDKIRCELGFECKTHLEAGVRDLQAALESKRISDYTDPLFHNQRFLKAAGRLTSKEETDTQVMAAFAAVLNNQQEPDWTPEKVRV